MKENIIQNKSLVIYFFSGTGNAKKVTHWIGDIACEKNYNFEAIDISNIDRKNIKIPEKSSIIGFVSPTHGFNLPPVMMYFLFRFPGSKGKNAFIVNTRAGMKMGRFFIPGLSGLAQYFYAILLIFKGYKVSGMKSIDLPSNWISLHPGLREDIIKSINERCKNRTIEFAQNILHGRNDRQALRDIVQDILISPISILYFLVGRFIFAKSFYANSHCNNCDLCIDNCPVKAISKVDNRPFWSYKCESCMKCMNLCPKRAIETAHGFIIGFGFIGSAILTAGFVFITSKLHIGSDYDIPFSVLKHIVDMAFTVFFFILSYRIFHYLQRVPLLKQLFEYTSLTRYKFWRRYKPNRKR